MTHMTYSKPWYRSRGIWGAILGAAGTIYGLWAAALPCGPEQTLHNYASAAITMYGAYLAFVGRKTAAQPVHFFWRRKVDASD
ncbi:MAG: hypothetical protein HOP13_19445 [Alphaproteobacteria bacterium]|nr:hypothetical protein [Alphaproteobacteria bacterium]